MLSTIRFGCEARELARVLAPDGWGVIAVPIIADKTFQDPSVDTDEERRRIYGFDEHVRAYGIISWIGCESQGST